MTFRVTKTYGHDQGLSCAFRQWRAKSHCNQLHGYALAFEFVFEAEELDDRGWVIDFGGLKWLLMRLKDSFDHTVAVSGDDPMLDEIAALHGLGVAKVEVWPHGVGCEKFARAAWAMAQAAVQNNPEYAGRVRVVSCKCSEHGANSATYIGESA